MAFRWTIGCVAGTLLVVGLVFQMWALTVVGLLGLLGAVVVRGGANPLAATYRDVRPTDRPQDW
jgi:hypothetical protein